MHMRPNGRRRRRQQEADSVFTPEPISRPAGPPASSAPVRDYLAAPRPGADASYVVVPRSLAEAMPLPWQQHMAYLLSEFHQAFSHITWPTYRVVPSRYEKLVDLDEEQLAEVGCLVEIDADGEMVYRDRTGRLIEHPAEMMVLVACLDPIPPPQPGPPAPGSPHPGPLAQQDRTQGPDRPQNPDRSPSAAPVQGPAPAQAQASNPAPTSNPTPARSPAQTPSPSPAQIPSPAQDSAPEDQLETPPRGFPAQQPPSSPDQPFGPTGYQDRRPGGYQDPRSGHRW
jgi:hypothetical protein